MKVKVKSLSRVQLFVTPWTVAYNTPPSMGFSRQEYWSGLSLPSPTDKEMSESSFSSKTTLCGCFSLLTDVPYSAVALIPNSQNDSVVFYFLKLTVVHIERTFFHTLPLFPTRSLRLPLDPCPASS